MATGFLSKWYWFLDTGVSVLLVGYGLCLLIKDTRSLQYATGSYKFLANSWGIFCLILGLWGGILLPSLLIHFSTLLQVNGGEYASAVYSGQSRISFFSFYLLFVLNVSCILFVWYPNSREVSHSSIPTLLLSCLFLVMYSHIKNFLALILFIEAVTLMMLIFFCTPRLASVSVDVRARLKSLLIFMWVAAFSSVLLLWALGLWHAILPGFGSFGVTPTGHGSAISASAPLMTLAALSLGLSLFMKLLLQPFNALLIQLYRGIPFQSLLLYFSFYYAPLLILLVEWWVASPFFLLLSGGIFSLWLVSAVVSLSLFARGVTTIQDVLVFSTIFNLILIVTALLGIQTP